MQRIGRRERIKSEMSTVFDIEVTTFHPPHPPPQSTRAQPYAPLFYTTHPPYACMHSLTSLRACSIPSNSRLASVSCSGLSGSTSLLRTWGKRGKTFEELEIAGVFTKTRGRWCGCHKQPQRLHKTLAHSATHWAFFLPVYILTRQPSPSLILTRQPSPSLILTRQSYLVLYPTSLPHTQHSESVRETLTN